MTYGGLQSGVTSDIDLGLIFMGNSVSFHRVPISL